MDSDMSLAAAYAAGDVPPAAAFAPQRTRPQQPRQQHFSHRSGGDVDAEMMGELPSVDDMEVAAAAAGVAPVPAVLAELGYFELGQQPEFMEESSSGEEESSSDEEHGAEAGSGIRLLLQLVSGGGDQHPAVTVHLLPAGCGRAAAAAAGAAEMAGEVAADSSYDSDSSDSDSSGSDSAASSESEEDAEPLDLIENYADIKKMIDGMDADADLDGGGDGGGGGNDGAHRAEQELVGAMPLPSLADLQLAPDEPVQVAGMVQSMLEGMIVVKAHTGSRALSEGCVLVLEDRTPIGCIEEIFGPVVSPFYALRYGGAQPMPAALQQGATVCSVDRLADFVLPEELRVRGQDVGGEEEEEADLEAQFSDDEAEAAHRRKLEAKRKQQPDGLAQGGRGPKQAMAGRRGGGRGGGGGAGRGGGRGGGGGRDRGGQFSGRGGGPGGMQPPQHQQQQRQPVVAQYHPHQQQVAQQAVAAAMPPPGRVFPGQLGPPPTAFQAQAAAAQLHGMNLQQQQQQGMYVQQAQQQGGYGGGYGYGGAGGRPLPPQPPGQQQHVMGQVLRAQYAGPAPQQRAMGAGAVMQPQYAARPPPPQGPPPPGFTPLLPVYSPQPQ
ncbi:hypothetical protein D9Q98_004451 [Chlorella vulgaris]|uniref:H/ACA ribonucleoprotein complex non-core subunit NAF1 n=1 Tax=Chlorella vulgaris TaxID=3077 RepID=A0A9D4TPP0_CHLVU|nr:hypothetical protein D9Q98_004451 [Chlorella vulgaris]